MFESIINFLKRIGKSEKEQVKSKDAAKERLHLVLMQDRANVSADFLDLMKQEIIEVIKKYIDVDENAIDVRLASKPNADGTTGAPALYANIPIKSIKEEIRVGMAREKNVTKENTSEKNEKQDQNVNNNDSQNKEQNSDNKAEEKKEDTKVEEKKEEIKEEVKNSETQKEDNKENEINNNNEQNTENKKGE